MGAQRKSRWLKSTRFFGVSITDRERQVSIHFFSPSVPWEKYLWLLPQLAPLSEHLERICAGTKLLWTGRRTRKKDLVVTGGGIKCDRSDRFSWGNILRDASSLAYGWDDPFPFLSSVLVATNAKYWNWSCYPVLSVMLFFTRTSWFFFGSCHRSLYFSLVPWLGTKHSFYLFCERTGAKKSFDWTHT